MLELLAAIWERLIKEFTQSSPLDLLIKAIAAFALATLVYITRRLWRKAAARAGKAFSVLVGLLQESCPRTASSG
jgi:hypothetical protein